jgi:CheY-specific phosphatase CheX
MSPLSPTDELFSRYGIDAAPKTVRRLGELVSRSDATTEQIAELISVDKHFTAFLLSAANARVAKGEDPCTTIQDALQRSGMGLVLLLAMHDPLLNAVQKTFRTMIGAQLKLPTEPLLPFKGDHLHCEIAFSGRAAGTAGLRLTTACAKQVAAILLNVPMESLDDSAVIADVVAEMSSMVVGNFKSNLCDAGLDCKLSPPAIKQTNDFALRSTDGILAERVGLCAPGLKLFVDLNVNPWGD